MKWLFFEILFVCVEESKSIGYFLHGKIFNKQGLSNMGNINRRSVLKYGILATGVAGLGLTVRAVDKVTDFEPEAELDTVAPDHTKIAGILADTYSPAGSDSVGYFGYFKKSHEISSGDMAVLARMYNPSGAAVINPGEPNSHTFDVRVMRKGDEPGIALRENGKVVGTIKGWKSSLTVDEIIAGTKAIEPSAFRPAMVRGRALTGDSPHPPSS